MRFLSIASVVIGTILLHSCNNSDSKTATVNTVFLDKTGMDTSIRPGDDFYGYVNGNWVKKTVIPDDQTGWGSFYSIYENNLANLRGILEDAAKANKPKGSLEQKVGDYYASGMDTVTIEKAGAEPLKPMLAKIDAIKDYKELMNLLSESYARGEGDLLGFYVAADDKNSSQYIPIFTQSGLSLPEKEYYTRTDSSTVAIRKALLQNITTLFMLTGTDSSLANKNAAGILALETEMAKSHRTAVELRDPQKNYNKMSIADLEKKAPNIGWRNFFAKINAKVDSVNVAQPGYFTSLSSILSSKPIDLWKTKVKFDYISNNSRLLSKAFRDANFAYQKVLSGQKKDSDRWKKMVNRVDGGLGELLGQLYVKKYYTDAAKKRMDELVNNLQKAFEARIKNLDWMSDSTKQRATTKLNAFLKKVGYPSKWKNYDDVDIDKGNFFGSAKSVQVHGQKEMIAKIGKAVDRAEWGMTPPTVNAYYNPSNNEIVFPAGILQPPFFDVNADDAINYGAIGMVIGHEMTHAFDDQGSQYDEVGNMQNWWTSADGVKFKEKTNGVVKQYAGFSVLDTLHLNGDLTQGENIADIGGIAIAYDAFKMTKQGQGAEKIDGFTPDQRFFLGFAQSWRERNRDEIVRMYVNVDPHSPSKYRVNGPLSNFDPFYKAFGIGETSKMFINPENRAKIW
ncbi:MAG: M13 family metallopeptidase [Ferruginibacter sp.]